MEMQTSPDTGIVATVKYYEQTMQQPLLVSTMIDQTRASAPESAKERADG